MTAPIPLFKGEAMLLSWGDTSSRGKTVTFELDIDSAPDAHPFKGLGTGKHGQKFMLVAVPVDDSGEPLSPVAPIPGSAAHLASADDAGRPPQKQPASATVETKKEYTLANRVGMTCGKSDFWLWIDGQRGTAPGVTDAQDAARWVRNKCGVESRTEIKPGTEAAAEWVKLETQYLMDTGQMAQPR